MARKKLNRVQISPIALPEKEFNEIASFFAYKFKSVIIANLLLLQYTEIEKEINPRSKIKKDYTQRLQRRNFVLLLTHNS